MSTCLSACDNWASKVSELLKFGCHFDVKWVSAPDNAVKRELSSTGSTGAERVFFVMLISRRVDEAGSGVSLRRDAKLLIHSGECGHMSQETTSGAVSLI
jgi:hypothetical protein